MESEIKAREEVGNEFKWNVESVYNNIEEFEKELESVSELSEIKEMNKRIMGKLANQSPKDIFEMYELFYTIERKLSKLYVYAMLRKDEDLKVERNKKNHKKIQDAYTEFGALTSWIDPELVNLPQSKIDEIAEAEEMEPYRIDFLRTVRMKAHTRSKEIEELLTLASKPFSSISAIFSNFTDSELEFEKAKDSKGEEHEITHAKYSTFIKSQDRELRKTSFESYHSAYKKHQGTLCEILNGTMQKDLFYANAKNYPSCLDATLFPKNIDAKVYRTLIETTRKYIPALHKYVELRKKILGVDELHLYDLYVPLIKGGGSDNKYSLEECLDLVFEASKFLGEEYHEKLKKGLTVERWIDWYENKGKRSGGYSCSHYDTFPFILLNYTGDLEDVFTCAHEGGHSMHSKLSSENQPYHYSDYSHFVAEVASEFQECCLFEVIMKKAKQERDKQRMLYLLNKEMEAIRTTFFRQVLFAEFELIAHEFAEKKTPLTPELMNSTFKKLYRDYYGPSVVLDDLIEVEWSRIPHFFLYRFYTYQYATGITAAMALSHTVINGGEEDRERYLNFLKSGCIKFPLELLKDAGIELTTEKPFVVTIKRFEDLVDKFEKTYFEDNIKKE